MKKFFFLICLFFLIFGTYSLINQYFFSDDADIPQTLSYKHQEYVSKDFFIQTSANRPKPDFEPTADRLKGDKYGVLNGGKIFKNKKTSEIYIEDESADPSRYVLYEIKK